MQSFYLDKDLIYIKKKKKISLLFAILFSFLFVVSFVLFITFSKYKTRTLIKISGSIVLLIFSFLIITLIFKIHYLSNLSLEYTLINKDKGVLIEGTIVESSSNIITLASKAKAYEITLKLEEGNRVYYLNENFINPFIKGQKVKISIVSNYIKEYLIYED